MKLILLSIMCGVVAGLFTAWLDVVTERECAKH